MTTEELEDASPTIDKGTELEYDNQTGRLVWISETYDKKEKKYVYTHVPLTNFDARITEALTYDDGAERRKYYEIEGALDNAKRAGLPKIVVKTSEFESMAWLSEWDGRAVVRVGPYVKDHTRAAIQFLSLKRGYPVRYVYSHAGWREIDGTWCYLHSAGAIDANGLNTDVDVEFRDTRLKVFDLPKPPEGEELREDVLTAISLLDDATILDLLPEWLVYFDIAKVFRAPLNEVLPITTSDFLAGKTGVYKTAYHALFQAFFGAGFTAGTLPANWSSTDNQLERVLHIFKDALCEIDDFKPHGNTTQIQKAHTKADRVFRGHANKQGRGRLRSTGDFAPTYYSRAFPSSSGEDIPTGQSLRGRMLIREIQAGDIDLAWSTDAQEQAATGTYARVMSGFLKWLAPRLDALKTNGETLDNFHTKRDHYIKTLEGSGAHPQTYGALADVYLGFEIFMGFALDIGAIDRDRADELTAICESALIEIGSYQGSFIRSEEPTTQFIDLIGAVLSSGRGHLCDIKTNDVPLAPLEPTLLGWDRGRDVTQRTADSEVVGVMAAWNSKGPCVGWIDEAMIYLEPTVAYAEAQKLARDKGAGIPFSEGTLYKRINEQGLVYADSDGKHIAKKVVINKKRKRVICIDASRILGADEEEPERSDGEGGECGE